MPQASGVQVGSALAETGRALRRGHARRAATRGAVGGRPRCAAGAARRGGSQAALPERVAYLRGLAQGADVPFADVLAVNALEEVFREQRSERCSSLAVAAPGGVLLAHAEQWSACELGNRRVVVERPGDGSPWVASPTVASCLPSSA